VTEPRITIAGRAIGPGEPAWVIAEISANHNQSYDEAARLVEVAADAGADAVKLQTYTADTMTLDVRSDVFRVGEGTLWEGRYLHELYREAHTPWEWQPRLREIALGRGIELFSSAFDPTAVDFLEEMHVPAHKLASFEIVDLELVERMAATGKPLIISTGMATEEEIDRAVQTARDAGAADIALLKCTSAYPAPPEEMNLSGIPWLAERYGVPAGLSDHTLGIAVPVAAVTLGATIVEKHFTASRAVPGPDSAFSLEPHEFRQMVDALRVAERAIGTPSCSAGTLESKSLAFRRSLFVVQDLRAGEAFTRENVRSIRPADGLEPRHLPEVLAGTAARDIPRGTPLTWDLIASRR
jgi:N-acetylneuraminate synthase